jgi:Flp pilus assembly protein TadD
MRARVLATIGLVAALGVGCGRHPGTPPSADEQARAQLLIASGNQAFVAGDFGLAARRYAAAAVIKKDDPAAYYGLGMALSKLGRDEDARAAYARARTLTKR